MAYGLSASPDGNDFPWVLNPPATYGTARPPSYGTPPKSKAASTAQGQDNRPRPSRRAYGKEPIPLLEALAKDYGFTLKLYPVPGPQMQNQTSLWLDVRRDRPDPDLPAGLGLMNPTTLKEASKIGFPMNRLVGVWWAGGEDDVRPAGELAKATLRLISVASAELLSDPDTLQIRRRQGQEQVASRDKVGENLYNRA